jgi:putative ABC transport system permease protein
LWVVDETSYDHFHRNIGNLYQLHVNAIEGGEVETWANIPFIAYEELKALPDQFRNVAISSGRIEKYLLAFGEKKFNKRVRFVSPEFLEMFKFDLIKGSSDQVLDDPLSVVLTESTSKALFGEQDPINKIITINNGMTVKVTGILKDIPGNSSFQFDALLAFELYERITPWTKDCINDNLCNGFEAYAELKSEADLALANRNVKGIIKKHTTWLNPEVFLYPMERWNLHGEFKNGKEIEDDQEDYVIGFSAIALGVLIIACINFMNLSTARAERRAREVGIRKIVGSQRKELVAQFLGESILITTISFLFALVIVELLLPLYNNLIQRKLFVEYSSPVFWLCAVSLILITGLFSGSYPAFYLSSFKPAKVLKGTMHIGNESILPRKVLVVCQFGFSIFLIIGTIIVYQQMEFGRSRHLGYSQQNLITVPSNDGLKKNYEVIKNELMRTGAVVSSTRSSNPITQIYSKNLLEWPANSGQMVQIMNVYAEYDYTQTTGMKLIDGRDFIEGINDTAAVILNKAAIDLMGLKNPICSSVNIAGVPREIIGITEDALMASPFKKIEPMYIELRTDWTKQGTPQNITIRLQETRELPGALKKIEAVFKKNNPLYPFEFSFADDDFNKKFKEVILIGRLTNIFATIAIFIACLGLFGLAAFTAERRTKEFGVRKILGASISNLVTLISNDFIKLVGISFTISAPIAWWVLTNYLERYPLRISFHWLILPATGFGVLLMSMIIVGAQAIRVALTNPVESLRSE